MFFHNLVPFIGFGFFDNLLMILAGDLIETQIGATMHLSVMACAALGNTISDVCGIGLAGYVEVIALRMGLPVPDLPQAQLNHTRVREDINLSWDLRNYTHLYANYVFRHVYRKQPAKRWESS